MKNVLLFKSRQKSRQNPFYQELLLKLDKSLTQAVFVENYEIKFSRSDYMHILEYLCRVSFLTTLDIYKDYFKSRHKWCKALQKNNPCILWPETEIAQVHHILCRSYCVFTLRVLWPMSFLIFIIDKVKNFATNNLPQVGVLVMYWDLCIERRDYRYNTSPIKYWGKGSTVGWY